MDCPYFKSVPNWAIDIGLIAFGTVGLYFLNIWVAVAYLIYSLAYNLYAMPVKHCQYCYYCVKDVTSDGPDGKTIAREMTVDEWSESLLQKHVECGKRWSANYFVLWLLPIVLIIISLER